MQYDAYDEVSFKEKFLNSNIKFDLILDDGPHTLQSMKTFITLYSQILTDNGILIIEDVQQPGWLDILKNTTPEHLKQYIQVYDLRKNKGRSDDIIFSINKSQKNHTKICVFMSDNRPLQNNFGDAKYHSLAAAINYNYCKKHNYDFIYYRPYLETENVITLYNCINPKTKETRHASWSKLLSTLEALKLNYEYVVYIDSDCIFKNTDIAIETFIESNVDKNLIFFNNKPWNLIKPCAGFYICKANIDTKEIIQKWYNYNNGVYDKTHPWEQGVLWEFDDKINISIIDSMMLCEENTQFLRHIGSCEGKNRKQYFLNFINTHNINYTENINNIQTVNYNTLSSLKEFFSIGEKIPIH